MCGIAGVIHRSGVGPPENDRVRAMLAAMRHRGPDGEAVVAMEGATLGNCRLAILDPDRARQPMGERVTGAHLTFNGFIANFRELRKGMEDAGEAFRTDGDTEVLLRALILRGAGCLPDLDGMFAFAFHDPRKKRTLLARDPHGVKPLYLAADGDRILFASEVKGLLAGLPGRPAADREALLEYLAFQVPLTDRTLFRGVRRLGPGRMIVVDPGEVRESAWWAPPPPDGGTIEGVRAALAESVGRCLRSDRPVARSSPAAWIPPPSRRWRSGAAPRISRSSTAPTTRGPPTTSGPTRAPRRGNSAVRSRRSSSARRRRPTRCSRWPTPWTSPWAGPGLWDPGSRRVRRPRR